jgi:hypothetical protein
MLMVMMSIKRTGASMPAQAGMWPDAPVPMGVLLLGQPFTACA